MRGFPYVYCRRLLRKAGAKQVGLDAVSELHKTMEYIALEISKRAVLFAEDDLRFRVNREHVKAGLREFLESASV